MKNFSLCFMDKHKVQVIVFVTAFILAVIIVSGCSKDDPFKNEEIEIEKGGDNISKPSPTGGYSRNLKKYQICK